MKVLAADIGTNSTLFLIAEVARGKVKVIERGIEENRLGAEALEDGSLSKPSINHNREIIKAIVARGHAAGCTRSLAAGTQALRRASNSDKFVAMSEAAGLPLRILTPEEESQTGWQGVFGTQGPGELVGLMDLGGGSCELALGNRSRPSWTISVPLGAVGVNRQFFTLDPPGAAEILEALVEIRRAYEPFRERPVGSGRLIAIGGTANAIAAINAGMINYTEGAVEGAGLAVGTVQAWCQRLMRLDRAGRHAVPGMPPARATNIHAGALILQEVMEILGAKKLEISERGLLFGVAMMIANDG